MKTALQVLQEKNVPQALIDGRSQADLNKLAKALDSEWKAPPEADVGIVFYEPKNGKGAGMFLKISTGGRGGIFERLNDGKELTAVGRAKAIELLTSVTNQAADLVAEL